MAAAKTRTGALAGLFLVLIAIGFVATVTLANNALKSVRLDLTDEGLFTLSEGTLNLLDEIEEPITLRYYFSDRLAREIPQIGIYGQRVQDMLEEFAAEADGMIRLEVDDPEPFTDVEDRAVAAGLQGVPVDQTGETVYFGLAGANATADTRAIPFFDERREPFLEYDLARMVYGLARPDKPKVGIISQLPLSGSNRAMLPPDAPDDSWMVWAQAENMFELEEIDPLTEALPDDLDLLVLVHPPFMSNLALYAVDQYVLKGGRLAVFVDPHSEADAQRPQRGGPQRFDFGSAANLQKLFDAWGVDVPSGELAGDLKNGQRVRAQRGAETRMQAVTYPLWMQLPPDAMSQTDIVTSQLEALRIASPGHIVGAGDGEGLEIEPIVQTSEQGGIVDVARVQGMQPDVVAIANQMEPVGRQTLSARLSGVARTAFPDGPPKPVALNKDDVDAETRAKAEATWEEQKARHAAQSDGSVAVVLTADVDLLADGLWVQVQDLFGERIAVPTASNGAFFQNLLENMTGSADLIGLRSRGGFQRPFTLIEDIQRDAERSFRAKEQELLASLNEAEQQLRQIQEATTGEAQVVLSEEQRAQIRQTQAEMLRIRGELRDVQFALRSDVEELTGWIKAANIAGMPLLVAVVAILAAVVRSRRRKRFQAEFAKHAAA